MPDKDKYARLTVCPHCEGHGADWDVYLNDYVISCVLCAGIGYVCGECYRDSITCKGEGVCWTRDPEAYFDPQED